MASVCGAIGVRSAGAGAVGVPQGDAVWQVLRRALLVPEVKASIELDEAVVDLCRCRAHVDVAHDVEGATGCSAMPLGTASFIRGNGFGGKSHVCLANEATRVLDARFAGHILEVAFVGKLLCRLPQRLRKKWCTSQYLELGHFGAGYCYLAPVHASAFTRTVRVLGPLPYLVAAAAFVSCVGVASGPEVLLEEIAPGVYHCTQSDRWITDVATNFIEKCGRIVMEKGPLVRVGLGDEGLRMLTADEQFGCHVGPMQGALLPDGQERVGRACRWLTSVGVSFPEDAAADLMLVVTAPSLMVAYFSEIRTRVKVFELLGDHVLKMGTAARVLSSGETAADHSKYVLSHANDAMAPLTMNEPLIGFVACGSLPAASKARANMIEGFIGCVTAFCGVRAGVVVADELGLMPTMNTVASWALPRHSPEDILEEMSAVLQSRESGTSDSQVVIAKLKAALGRL